MRIELLKKGDWVRTAQGVGSVESIGKNGIWIYFPTRHTDYIQKEECLKYLCNLPSELCYREDGSIGEKK